MYFRRLITYNKIVEEKTEFKKKMKITFQYYGNNSIKKRNVECCSGDLS